MSNTESPNNQETINQELNNQDMVHFKLCLKEYLKLDDEIKTLQIVLKTKKTKFSSFEDTLLTFLEKNKINQVQLEGDYYGKELISEKTTKTTNVSKDSLMDIIKLKCGDNSNLLTSIMDEIEKYKETNEISKIKISNPKKKKEKAKVNKTSENEEINKLLLNTPIIKK